MALIEDIFEGPTALLVGIGAVILAPTLVPATGRLIRPVVKAGVRGYMAAADYFSEMASEANDQMGDIVAEVRAERQGAHAQKGRTRARARRSRKAAEAQTQD